MAMTDPIADMLTRIRNANTALKNEVEIPFSKIKGRMAEILKEEGYINDFEVVGTNNPQSTLKIKMKYWNEDERVINGLKRISKPGMRVYAKRQEIPRVLGGLGIAIISTSEGIITDRVARQKNVGGEVICYVW